MATDTASLKISVDSRDVKNSTKDLDNLSKSSSNAEKSTTSLSSTLKVSLAASAALAATALYKAASAGVTFNKSMEDSAAGLSALTVATSSNISAMGKHLSITEKYNLAIAESKKTVQQLNAINAETPHSLEDTTKIYKSMYVSMKNAGASNEQMIHLTKQLSIAAGSAGIEINSLLSGVDGLANGTVETASDFGRFMSSLGLTNEELKKSTNVVELLQSKLGEFKVLDTMTVAVSNFDNAWSQLTGTLTKDIFSSAKDDINTFTAFLVKANDKLSDYKANIENISDIHKIDSADVAIRELTQLVAKYDDLKESGIGLFQSTENYNAELKNQEFLINSLTKKLERLQETKDVLVAKEKDPVLTYEKWLKDEEKKALKTKSNAELAKDFEKRKQEEDKKNESKKEEAAKKAIKAEEDRLKKSHEIAQSQLKMIQEESDKKIKLQEDYYNTLNDIVQKNDSEKLDGLAKEAFDTFAHYDSLIEKYKEVAGAESALRAMQTMAIDTIIEKQKELDEAYNNKTAIDSLDEIYGRYSKLIDAQIELAENGMNIDFDFGDGAKELNNISKAMQQLHVGSLKYTKQDMKMQEDYAKAYLEAGNDTVKQAQLEADFDADNAAINKARQSAEIAGYANLAGAIAGAFEEGSGAAKAFQAIQATLGIVNGFTAISGAWASAPFPANLPAVAATTAQMLPLIGTLTSLGGSSGSGGGVSAPIVSGGMTAEQNIAKTELVYEPMTNRLDRQIELLESIDRKGSASALSVERAALSFQKEYAILVQETLGSGTLGGATKNLYQVEGAINEMEQRLGFNILDSNLQSFSVDTESLSEGFNYLRVLSDEMARSVDFIQNAGWGKSGMNAAEYGNLQQNKVIDEFQGILADFSSAILDSMDELKSAAEDFEGFFDDITGTQFYETKRLEEAYKDVEKLTKGKSFSSYLQGEIKAIDDLGEFFTNGVFETLMSQDKSDLVAQLDILDELAKKTGMTFENGAREALDYLESIKLVAEAMATSRENIKSFTDSFKTSEQLAQDMASTLGVAIATTGDELVALFNNLSGGVDGLTDAELELLNANKDLIDSGLDDYISSITSDISSLESVISSLSSVIDNLKGAAIGSTYSMQKYYDSMSKTLSLSGSDDIASFQKSLNDTISASSVLFDAANFTTSRDQQFAQLVAANQFSTMEDTALEQIDYLKLIEINTREQIDAILSLITALGKKIDDSLMTSENPLSSVSASNVGAGGKTLDSIMASIPDNRNATAPVSLDSLLASGLNPRQLTSDKDYVFSAEQLAAWTPEAQEARAKADVVDAYARILGTTPTQNAIDVFSARYLSGELASSKDLYQTIAVEAIMNDFNASSATNYLNKVGLRGYAVGTPNVPYDMIAQIHQGEMIVPKTFNEGLQSGNITIGQNNTDLLVRELNNLNQKQNAIITILQESQNIQNINLQKLTLIEAAN